ncbi:hypothetical protein ES692_07535 [Psychroserpens burtonensis]|uniref:Lipoprotein n=1 Tax=Psychroserpens burtonensis TaxID=49278 RepID=A0A5C7BCB9_9FLAO|nr:hypothetical protein [Psychroserpens burtonensis]TXE18089.1 hypothetical protein ES692_07535 [Psychroserpens burtonensis]
MKTTLKILGLSMLLILSCNKDDDATGFTPTLPAITQVGANTFGCYAGNTLITPRNGTGTFNSTDRGMRLWGGGISPEITYNEIDVHDYKSERTSSVLIHVQALHANGSGEYPILESNGQANIDGPDHTHVFCRIWKNETEGYQYYLSIANTGNVNVSKYDFDAGIVSGTFSCEARNFQTPYDTIQITQGRFDINGFTLPEKIFQ